MAINTYVIVAGHVCLDIFPNLDQLKPGGFSSHFKPGQLIEVGPAGFSGGGPVANTGLALDRLGIPTRLAAKIGDDPFGHILIEIIAQHGHGLDKAIRVDPAAVTSYSVIISPPDTDRIFLHCPGANDMFDAGDIPFEAVKEAGLFHFGYPPIMRRMYIEDGRYLVELMQRVKKTGVTTSMDMAYPDPNSESGRVDWKRILKNVLPAVDLFLPSFEELLFLLDPQRHACMSAQGDLLEQLTPGLLEEMSDEVIGMGAKILAIKLGAHGLYLRSAGLDEMGGIGRASPANVRQWANREMWTPCFRVQVAGTTGSGDATIAGILSAFLRDFSPEQAMTMAVAVGACNVEAMDAFSGLRSWEDTLARVENGWPRHPLEISANGWQWDGQYQIWHGPHDKAEFQALP